MDTHIEDNCMSSLYILYMNLDMTGDVIDRGIAAYALTAVSSVTR